MELQIVRAFAIDRPDSKADRPHCEVHLFQSTAGGVPFHLQPSTWCTCWVPVTQWFCHVQSSLRCTCWVLRSQHSTFGIHEDSWSLNAEYRALIPTFQQCQVQDSANKPGTRTRLDAYLYSAQTFTTYRSYSRRYSTVELSLCASRCWWLHRLKHNVMFQILYNSFSCTSRRVLNISMSSPPPNSETIKSNMFNSLFEFGCYRHSWMSVIMRRTRKAKLQRAAPPAELTSKSIQISCYTVTPFVAIPPVQVIIMGRGDMRTAKGKRKRLGRFWWRASH